MPASENLHKSGRSQISIKSDPDRFGAVITRSRSSDAEGTIEALTGAVMSAIAMAAVGFPLQRKAAKE
jgi:hypothetical protein